MSYLVNKLIPILLIFLMSFLLGACKKFLDVGNPPDKIVAKYVFESNASAIAAVTGIYPSLNFVQGQGSIPLSCGLTADELVAYPSAYGALGFYNNSGGGDFYWSMLYAAIYKINAAVEGISASSKLSLTVKNQLLGEVFFLRAFCYFYLVNLYGDVPLLLQTDYKLNSRASRTPISEVYKSIELDLNQAKSLLSDKYLSSNLIDVSEDRLRPNKSVAMAFWARVDVYTNNWNHAKEASTYAIDNKNLYDLVNLDGVFLKNSKEAVWQIQPRPVDGVFFNTLDARLYVLKNGPNDSKNPVWLSDFLLTAFENGDYRRETWIKTDTSNGKIYYYPFKYRIYENDLPVSEYNMILRLAEQYLIRAEANAHLGDLDGARNDLNAVRKRAGLANTKAETQAEILNAILHERQTELFTEWGHRWFDLIREDKIDAIMGVIAPLKGGEWASYKKKFPIPIRDIQLNPNLVQNEGYNF